MVVQHILCSRIGKREVKPTVPEVKAESPVEKTESDTPNKEGEDEIKEETPEKEPDVELDNKDEKEIETSDDKKSSDIENETKDNSKEEEEEEEEEVSESKQEDAVAEVKPQIIEIEEYFVKYRNFSYLHCEWRTEEELYKGDKRIQAKLKRFKQRQQQNTNIFENVIIDLLLHNSVLMPFILCRLTTMMNIVNSKTIYFAITLASKVLMPVRIEERYM